MGPYNLYSVSAISWSEVGGGLHRDTSGGEQVFLIIDFLGKHQAGTVIFPFLLDVVFEQMIKLSKCAEVLKSSRYGTLAKHQRRLTLPSQIDPLLIPYLRCLWAWNALEDNWIFLYFKHSRNLNHGHPSELSWLRYQLQVVFIFHVFPILFNGVISIPSLDIQIEEGVIAYNGGLILLDTQADPLGIFIREKLVGATEWVGVSFKWRSAFRYLGYHRLSIYSTSYMSTI